MNAALRVLLVMTFMSTTLAQELKDPEMIEQRVSALLAEMTLIEKIGQMSQVNAGEGYPPDNLGDRLRAGHIGSVLNSVDVNAVNELQRCATVRITLGPGREIMIVVATTNAKKTWVSITILCCL